MLFLKTHRYRTKVFTASVQHHTAQMRPLVAVPATALLVYRAWSRQSLTPLGILAATVTAVAHALHDWSVFYALLAAFFLAGTAVTKVYLSVAFNNTSP